MKKYKVYVISNSVNSNLYVGVTSLSIEKRMSIHKMHSTSKCSNVENRSLMYKDILKFGFDKFSIKLLKDGLSKREALDLETKTQRNNLFLRYSKKDTSRIRLRKFNSCYKLVSETEVLYFKTTVAISKMFNCHRSNVTRSLKDNYLLFRKYKVYRIEESEFSEEISKQITAFGNSLKI